MCMHVHGKHDSGKASLCVLAAFQVLLAENAF